jgi:protocatechuate 3,4-dioxygenase beta subunit
MKIETRHTVWTLGCLVLCALILAACGPGQPTPTPTPTPGPGAGFMPDEPFGITFASHWGRDNQVRRDPVIAVQVGASWDRWPFPWNEAEPNADGHFEWEAGVGDDNVDFINGLNLDNGAGLKVIGVLDGGIPAAYRTPDGPYLIEGLEQPPFLDNGTINPENRWARYVWAVTTNEQIAGEVDAWEIINEFNLVHWDDPMRDETYQQALWVACEVLERTDGSKPVLLGGPEDKQALLAAKDIPSFYRSVLRYAQDDLADCIDGISLHSFGNPRRSAYMVEHRANLWPGKPMWFTEAGLQHETDRFPFDSGEGVCVVERAIIDGTEVITPTGWPCGTVEHQASYVTQHTLLAWQALLTADTEGVTPQPDGATEGKVFHHSFIDGPDVNDQTQIWGLLDKDGGELPAKRSAEFIFGLLRGAEFWSSRSGKDADNNPYEWIVFETSDRRVVNVLWAIGDQATTVQFESNQTGWSAQEYDQEGNPIALHSSSFALELSPTDHPARGSSTADEEPYPGEPMLGGTPVILIEVPDKTSPVGGASLVWTGKNCTGWPVGTHVWGRDDESGLDHVTVECSPATEYDLRWTEPGRLYSAIVPVVPPRDTTCTLTLYDRAGNFRRQTLYNPGPKKIPGCDHSDDNHSAASVDFSSIEFLALPEGSRSMPRVAILDSGFAGNMLKFLFDLGEPSVLIESDFDPVVTAAQYPVLIIPSGGLYGMEGSVSFHARLEEYTRLGGTIVAFDQQHGYEYGALPGGQVGGYGWNEDVSCSGASLMMETWHPLLSGLDRANVYAHVDGFFAPPPGGHWPEGTQVLLSRKANGRPAAILYPYPPPSQGGAGGGSGGWVFATTMYDDWGSGQGQAYEDARVILRDLLTWAIDDEVEGGGLPQFAPGNPATMTISMTNTSAYTATAATLRLVDPARQVAFTRVVSATIPPFGAGTVPFTTTAGAPLGIWRVEAALSLGNYPLTGKQQVARYVVTQPPALVDPARPLYLSITAPDDTFVQNTLATFTYHVYNYGSEPLTATVHYGFNHDFDWHGIYRVLAENVVVPPADGETPGEVAIPFETPVKDRFMLRGHVIAGEHRAYAAFGVRTSPRAVLIWPSLDPKVVQRGQTAELQASVGHLWGSGGNVTATLHIRAMDAARTFFHADTLTVTFGSDRVEVVHQIAVPASAAAGTGQVWIEAHALDGTPLGGAVADFTIPASPLAFSVSPPPPVAVESTVPISVTITNTSASLPVESGVLTLTLATPGGAITPTATTTFALAPSSSRVLTLPLTIPPLAYGPYTVTVDTVDEYGTRHDEAVWHTTPLVEGTLDQPTYRARDVAHLDLRLVNPGPFTLPLTATLTSPTLPYSHTYPLTLQPHGIFTITRAIPIPPGVAAGTYPLTLTLTLPGGDTLTQVSVSIQIPASDLAISSDAPASLAPGQTVVATLANDGGADTPADYDLRIVDARGYAVAGAAASAYPIQAGQSITVPLALPEGVATGHYTILCTATDRTTGERATLFTVIQIDGVEATVDVSTDRLTYLTTDAMTLTAELDNGPQPLEGGALTRRVTQPAGVYRPLEPEFTTYTTADSGLSGDDIRAVTVDGAGSAWFATDGNGVSVRLASGEWLTYTTANSGLSSDWVADIAVDDEGNAWFATEENGVSARLAGGSWITYTTANSGLGSDDVWTVAVDGQGNAWFSTLPYWDEAREAYIGGGVSVRLAAGSWITYTTANSGLSANAVYDIVVDGEGNAWFSTPPYGGGGTEVGGVSVRLAGGEWLTYTMANSGLGSNAVYGIAVDGEGNVWLATPPYWDDELEESVGGGVSVRLAGGSWITYTTANSGLSSDWVRAIAVDGAGNAWFATEPYWDDDLGEPVGGGVSVLLADGSWRQYGYTDGLGSDDVTAIAVAPDGSRWVGTCPISDLGQPGGVTAIRGPLAVLTPWQSYTDPFEPWGDNYYAEITHAAVDPAGNRWFAGGYPGEGYTAYLYRLPADEGDWETFSAGWREVTGLAVDSAGTAWLASWSGVRARDAQGNWEEYTVESTGGSLLSDSVTSIAVDGEDRVWFATQPWRVWDSGVGGYVNVGGGVSVLSGTTWITYTAGNSNLPSNWIDTVTIGDAGTVGNGNVWVTVRSCEDSYCDHWDTVADGVAMFSGTSWITYTTANSPLPSDDVRDIAVDGAGNAWFATAPYWDEDLQEEVSSSLTLRRADGSWVVYTAADGLPECGISPIAVARDGTVWLSCGWEGEGGIFTFSPASGEVVQHTVASSYGGLVSNNAVDLAVDGLGDVWVVGGEYYDEDLGEWVDGFGVSRYTGLTRVLWQSTVPVDLAGGAALTETIAVPASELGTTGRMHLEGELTTAGGQRLAFDRQPFTVYAASAPALSVAAQPSVAAPGESVILEVSLRNGNSLPLVGQEITVTLGGEAIAVLDAPEIPAGDTWSTTVSTIAPAGEVPVWAEVSDGVRTARDRLTVSARALDVTLEAPDVAGRAPFDLVLVLENPSLHDLDVQVTIGASDPELAGHSVEITIPVSETRVLVEPYAISADTTFTVTITGDIDRTVFHTVTFGEAAAVDFSPQPVYPEGPLTIPYTATNTGVLPVQFTTVVTVQSPISNLHSSFSTYLSVGESTIGSLLLDLPAGDYTLTYATPFETGAVSFRVAPAAAAELAAVAGARVGDTVTVTATVTNTGLAPIEGTLRVESAFFTVEQPITVAPSPASVQSVQSVDLTAAEPGTHPVTLTLLAGNGSPLASTTVTVTAPGPELVLTSVPTETGVRAGEWVTLTFGVENVGSAPATAVISATVGDLLDEARGVWLPGGESGTVAFVFQVPEGLLDGGSLVCAYWFEGQRYDFALPIVGVDLDVQATWDHTSYAPGDTATLRLTVVNEGATPTPPMYAHVAYQGDQVFTQTLSLAGGETAFLDFSITVGDSDEDPKVFYAIYEASEDRGIYLNTTYLYVRHPDVTVVPNKHVYQPGETVYATVRTSATGELVVTAPGYTTTIHLAGSDALFQFTLPAGLARGTYTIDYALDGGPIHSVLFDLDAPWVRTTEARLIGVPYMPDDDVQIDLTIASTHDLDVSLRAWLVYPDGTRNEGIIETVSLRDALNNHVTLTLPLSTAQSGPHLLVYLITDADDTEYIYAAGSEAFDVGSVTVLSVRTDRETYPRVTDPVTASLTVFATAPTDADLTLLVDDVPVVNATLALTAGVQTIAVPVPGPMAPDWHDLTARVEAGGLSHEADTTFAYGTAAVDLVVGAPYLVGTTGVTRTLRAHVSNVGETDAAATTVQLWDGDPEAGGTLLGVQPIPALAVGESACVELTWDVLGQGGPHTIVAVVDPDDVVAEFYEYNNVFASEVTVPPFALTAETDALSYDEGDPVDITIHLTNLTDGALTAVVTTTVESMSHQVVFTDVHTFGLEQPAHTSDVYADSTVTWGTAWAANDAYTIYVVGESGIGSEHTIVVNNVPPTVEAGADQSAGMGQEVSLGGSFTDPGLSDTHAIWWDFGDGFTSSGTVTSSHTYAAEGVYTATLTVTDSDGGVGSDTVVVTVSEGVAGDLICPSLAGPVTYVDSGYAPTCTGVSLEPGKLKLVDSGCNPIANARVNLRKANGGYITYKKTGADGVVDFSDYGGSAVPSLFEVDYHGGKYTTAVGSYDTGAVVQTREYRLQFIGSDCAPIENARVNLRKSNDGYVTYVKTDADGVAAFQVVPEAQMKLEVDYHGAKWLSEANTANVDVMLGAEAFRLHLVDSSNNPIENARVNLRKANDGYVTYVKTDGDGWASFDVVPGGDLKLEVDYHGAKYATSPSTSHAPETVQTRAFSLRVTDSTGQPIENARVNLRKANDGYVTYVKTGADGVASFEVVPGAQMKLEIDYHGAKYATPVTTITEDTQLEVQTLLFGVHLTNTEGQPIEGARVNLRKADNAYVTYVKTDAGGYGGFEVVPHAVMVLEVDYQGDTYATDPIEVTENTVIPVQFDVVVEVQTQGLAMKVTDSVGQPVVNARVNLRNAGGGYVTYAKTDSAGVAFFEVVPGAEMRLELDYHGASYMTDPVVVDGYVELQVQTRAFSLLLTDSTGQPVENARVNLRKSNDAYVTYVKTGDDGVASLEVVPGAEMKLEVDYHGATYATPVTEVTNDTQLEVQTMAFSLRLIDSAGQPIENARVNLRKANDAYVTYAKTGTGGIASFEVVPGAQMKLEVDYHGGKYATAVTTVDANMQLEVQTVALTVHVTVSGVDLVNQRVDLLKADSGYVTYAKTGTGGRVTFEVLPGVQHKMRCTYDGNMWISDDIIGPAEVACDFV